MTTEKKPSWYRCFKSADGLTAFDVIPHGTPLSITVLRALRAPIGLRDSLDDVEKVTFPVREYEYKKTERSPNGIVIYFYEERYKP